MTNYKTGDIITHMNGVKFTVKFDVDPDAKLVCVSQTYGGSGDIEYFDQKDFRELRGDTEYMVVIDGVNFHTTSVWYYFADAYKCLQNRIEYGREFGTRYHSLDIRCANKETGKFTDIKYRVIWTRD